MPAVLVKDSRLPGIWTMAVKLSEVTGKDADSLYRTIRSNVRFLLKNIPPEEILAIFEEE